MEAVAENALYGFKIREPDLRRTDNKKYNIKQLWQRSNEVVLLALQGLKQTEIAEILNISPTTVSNILNSDLGKERLSELRERRDEKGVDFSKRILQLTEKALEVYEDIFDNKNANLELRKKTADTIVLDIAGHRAPTKVQSHNVNTQASLDEIEAFKRRGIEAAKDAGLLIDVTPEKEDEPES